MVFHGVGLTMNVAVNGLAQAPTRSFGASTSTPPPAYIASIASA
jgi:hypothetical protein